MTKTKTKTIKKTMIGEKSYYWQSNAFRGPINAWKAKDINSQSSKKIWVTEILIINYPFSLANFADG